MYSLAILIQGSKMKSLQSPKKYVKETRTGREQSGGMECKLERDGASKRNNKHHSSPELPACPIFPKKAEIGIFLG